MKLPEYPTVTASVSGRAVVASGHVVLGRYDKEVALDLDGLTFSIAFVPDPGTLAADAQVLGGTHIRIRFTGTIGPMPISYELGGVAVWNGFWIDLALVITAVDEGAIVRGIAYSFTAGMRADGDGQ